MSMFCRPAAARNCLLRLLSSGLVLAGQVYLWNGCNAANQPTPTPVPTGQSTGLDEPATAELPADTGDGADGLTPAPEPDVELAPVDATAAGAGVVDGYWLSSRLVDGEVRTGLVSGGQISQAVSLDIVEEDGESWTFSGSWSGETISGTCGRPLDFSGEFDPASIWATGDFGEGIEDCSATFSADGRELSIAGPAGDWTLRRSLQPAPALTGVRVATGMSSSRVISAYDGRVLALLLPDTDPPQGMTAAWDDSQLAFIGSDPEGRHWVGVLADDEPTLLAWVDDYASFISYQTLVPASVSTSGRPSLTGRWMSVYNIGEYTTSVRGQAVLIDDGDKLYAWQRDDNHRILYAPDYTSGGYWSISADVSAGSLQGDANSLSAWTGRLQGEGTLLAGHLASDRTRNISFARSLAPSAAMLTGDWTSLSVDYTTPSEPVQTIGRAALSYNDGLLTGEDELEGETYHLEARWMGDHFAGEWWNAATPNTRGQWTGELVLEGAMLHGKYEMGEWSFALDGVAASPEDLEAVPAGQAYVVASPESPIALVARDGDTGDLIQYLMQGGRVHAVKVISATGGSALITLDDRLLVTAIDLESGDHYELEWSNDLTGLTVTQSDANGVIVTQTMPIDLSNAGLAAALQSWENTTGGSAQLYRDYLAENGNPWIGGAGQPKVDFRDQVQNSPGDRVIKVVGGGSTLVTGIQLIAAGVKLAGANLAAGSTMMLAGGAGLLALGAVMILATVFLIFICFPCTLACFWNCDLPTPPERACCTNSGCTLATQDACARAGGTYHPSETSCTQSTCGEPDVQITINRPCCLFGGGCIMTSDSQCSSFSGEFMAGSGTCEDIVCPSE